jgi:hypothetical protein
MFDNPKPTLTPKQQRAIEALLAGLTKSQAATAAGVTPRTLSRWLAEPTFKSHLTRATDQAIGDATRRLATALDQAVTVLSELMLNQDASPPDRLRAASLILRRSLDFTQQQDILERISSLESITGFDDK